jgi:hypothetical protein
MNMCDPGKKLYSERFVPIALLSRSKEKKRGSARAVGAEPVIADLRM